MNDTGLKQSWFRTNLNWGRYRTDVGNPSNYFGERIMMFIVQILYKLKSLENGDEKDPLIWCQFPLKKVNYSGESIMMFTIRISYTVWVRRQQMSQLVFINFNFIRNSVFHLIFINISGSPMISLRGTSFGKQHPRRIEVLLMSGLLAASSVIKKNTV